MKLWTCFTRFTSSISVILLFITATNASSSASSNVRQFHQVEKEAVASDTDSRTGNNKILVCYYRKGIIDDNLLPVKVCTHIIIAFAVVTSDGIVPSNASDIAHYRSVVKLKEKNPNLKVVISLQKGFPSVVSYGTEEMLRFSLAAVSFADKYGFDGIDLDWETPNLLQKNSYSQFIMILSDVLHWSNKTLSMALPNSVFGFEGGYFADTINKYTDFNTVMTYDFHSYTKHTHKTDFNSPLFSPHGDDPFRSTAGIINYFISRGVSPSKLLLGFPTYGRSWKLEDPSNHGVHAPAIGLGDRAPVTKMDGYFLFQDVCVAQQKGGKMVIYEQAGAEYLVWNSTWVAYNGMYSASIKAAWLKKNKLAGVGVWTFEDDDPHNICGMGSFPVLTKLRSFL